MKHGTQYEIAKYPSDKLALSLTNKLPDYILNLFLDFPGLYQGLLGKYLYTFFFEVSLDLNVHERFR